MGGAIIDILKRRHAKGDKPGTAAVGGRRR